MLLIPNALRSGNRLVDIARSFGRIGSQVHTRRASTSTAATINTTATLYYLSRLELYKHEKPYHINVPPSALPPGMQSTEKSEGYDGITIKNLRGREREFNLDNSGFQVFQDEENSFSLNSALEYDEYADFQTVKSRYREAVSKFLVDRLGAEAVFPFTHEVRRRASVFPRLPRGTGEAPQPVQGVHVDFTPRWAMERTRMAFGESTLKYLMTRRWQVLNIWRPLFGPLQDWPLAVCDWRSINPSQDLVASDNVYTHTAAETYNLYHSPLHEWYFLQGMRPEETLVFKSYDSRSSNNTARVCPHAAFRDPLAPAEARPRESVECLAIVVYPPSDSEDGQDVHEEVSKAFSDRSRADESRHYPNWDYRSFPRT